MPGFLYFVPGAQTMEQAKVALEKAGAAHAVETVGRSGPTFNQVSISGADSAGGVTGSGCVVGRDGFFLYNKHTQDWRRAPVLVEGYEGPGYWVGFDKEAKHYSDALQSRPRQFALRNAPNRRFEAEYHNRIARG